MSTRNYSSSRVERRSVSKKSGKVSKAKTIALLGSDEKRKKKSPTQAKKLAHKPSLLDRLHQHFEKWKTPYGLLIAAMDLVPSFITPHCSSAPLKHKRRATNLSARR